MRLDALNVSSAGLRHADQANLREEPCRVFDVAQGGRFIHVEAGREFGGDGRRGPAIAPFVDPRRRRVQPMQPAAALLEKQQFVTNDLRDRLHTTQQLHSDTLAHAAAQVVGEFW